MRYKFVTKMIDGINVVEKIPISVDAYENFIDIYNISEFEKHFPSIELNELFNELPHFASISI